MSFVERYLILVRARTFKIVIFRNFSLTIRGVYEIIISRWEESKLFAFNDKIHAIRY